MSIDEVMRVANDFGFSPLLRHVIEQHVAEEVAREREECALIADEWSTFEQRQFGKGGPAAAIRARGTT